MPSEVLEIKGRSKSTFKDMVMGLLPEGGNLNLCLTCGLCSSGCPASGLEDMDPESTCAWRPSGWMTSF
jgi:heterodisulfide reductase subunit C